MKTRFAIMGACFCNGQDFIRTDEKLYKYRWIIFRLYDKIILTFQTMEG